MERRLDRSWIPCYCRHMSYERASPPMAESGLNSSSADKNLRERLSASYLHLCNQARRRPVLAGALLVGLGWAEVVGVQNSYEQRDGLLGRMVLAAQAGIDHLHQTPTGIDPDFERTGFRAEHMREAMAAVFGEQGARLDIGRVRLSPVSILMTNDRGYAASGQHEAGHCSLSHVTGRVSEIVLTPEFVQGESDEQLRVFIHEASHAADWMNSDTMTEAQRGEIRGILLRIAMSERPTPYAYVNGHRPIWYQVGEGAQRPRMQELFAEFMAHTVLLSPLSQDDPLMRLPLRERMRLRFVRMYGLASSEADMYAQLAAAVARWRGTETFFEQAQQRLERLRNRLHAERSERDHQRAQEMIAFEVRQRLGGISDHAMRTRLVGILSQNQDEHRVVESLQAEFEEIQGLNEDAQTGNELDDLDSAGKQILRTAAESIERQQAQAYQRSIRLIEHNPRLKALAGQAQTVLAEFYSPLRRGLRLARTPEGARGDLERLEGSATRLERIYKEALAASTKEEYRMFCEALQAIADLVLDYAQHEQIQLRVPRYGEAVEIAERYRSHY